MNYNSLLAKSVTAAFLFMSANAYSQNEFDALTISQSQTGSTALSTGMGGAGGSMGGDINAVGINPAGIGVYRKQEFSFTPILKINSVESEVEDFGRNRNSAGFYMGSAGLIITHRPHSSLWKNVNMGFTMNTTNQFKSKNLAQYENYTSSVTDIMADDAYYNGIEQYRIPPYGFLGYQGYLIDDDFYSIVPVDQGLSQRKTNQTSGNVREYSFTLGGNYAEKILLGASANIVSLRYDRKMNYSEDDMSNNSNNNFKYLDLNETIYTDGIGFNAKFGAIFVPTKNVKLGIAFHTPTWMMMDDYMDYELISHTENFKADLGGSDIDPVSIAQPDQAFQYTYSFRTPYKFILSATVLGQMGMLTADYEFNDYSTMRYSMPDDPNYEKYVNDNIKDNLNATHTIRIGGELALSRFFIRAGGAYTSSPYNSTLDFDNGERVDLAAGFGFRLNSMIIDLGYRHSLTSSYQNMYNMNSTGVFNPMINYRNNTNYLALTLGFKL